MKRLAPLGLIATFIALSSCVTDREEMSPASGEPPHPEEADKAIVCRFGSATGSDTDQKKGCTTATDREEVKQPQPSQNDADR